MFTMKNTWLILFCGLFLCGCEKIFMPCIDVVRNSPGKHLISGEEDRKARSLLDHINVPTIDLQVVSIDSDFFNGTGYHIRCNQFEKNYMYFNQEVIYHIKDGILMSISGDIVSDTADNQHHITVSETEAAKRFQQRMEGDPDIRDRLKELQQNCFQGELGLMRRQIWYALSSYVITWKIKPVSHEYPLLYLNAETGEEIFYFNGIIYLFENNHGIKYEKDSCVFSRSDTPGM